MKLSDSEFETIIALRNGSATVTPVPFDQRKSGLAINEEATAAAREGAAGITPAFDQIADEDRAIVLSNLELNDSERLKVALEAYARTLSIGEIRAIIAEA